MPVRHLLSAWNPVAGAAPMETHLRVLHDGARKYRMKAWTEDEVYVWWGQPRRRGRDVTVPDLAGLEIEPTRNDPGPETHLYLTDFASLYVGHLGGVQTADPHLDRREVRVPSHYRRQRLDCAIWFKLWDVRRLIENDPRGVAFELHRLRAIGDGEGERPVSPYDGGLPLPVMVTDTREVRYFDPDTRRAYTDGKLWVEFDAEHTGTGAVERDLRENLFGEDVWRVFGPTSRTFIASGERLFRDNAHDPLFDLGLALLEYCKALEVQCNSVLRRALRDEPVATHCMNIHGRSVDLTHEHAGLADLARFIGGDPSRVTRLKRRLKNGDWFTCQLPAVMAQLADVRNRVAHSDVVSREEVMMWRGRLCGIGCLGHFVQLGQVELVN